MPKKPDEAERRIQEVLQAYHSRGKSKTSVVVWNLALVISDFYDAFTVVHLVQPARGQGPLWKNPKSKH